MKLIHAEFGETYVDSTREANRLAQYGWTVAPEKTSRKRSKPVEPQPELLIEAVTETE